MFVCTPGNEVLMSALCDGNDNCGGGNYETSLSDKIFSIKHNSYLDNVMLLISPRMRRRG